MAWIPAATIKSAREANKKHVENVIASIQSLKIADLKMKTSDVRAMRDRLAGFAFDDVYGYTWGRNIRGGARAAVDASFERFLAFAAG